MSASPSGQPDTTNNTHAHLRFVACIQEGNLDIKVLKRNILWPILGCVIQGALSVQCMSAPLGQCMSVCCSLMPFRPPTTGSTKWRSEAAGPGTPRLLQIKSHARLILFLKSVLLSTMPSRRWPTHESRTLRSSSRACRGGVKGECKRKQGTLTLRGDSAAPVQAFRAAQCCWQSCRTFLRHLLQSRDG